MDERILARIAELFYVYGISQYEIAEKFNFSKAKVCRLIKKARKKKIIEFNIKKPEKYRIDLEKKIEDKFGLKEVVIYYGSCLIKDDDKLVFEGVGSIGADYIERILKNNLNIAVGGGKTLYHTFEEINSRKKYKINIFSTLGGISLSRAEYQNNDLIKMLSEKIGGICHSIYLPIMFKKIEDKELFLKENGLYEMLNNPLIIDYYIASVGPISKKSHYYTLDFFDEEFIKILQKKSICGEIGLNFFDIEGNFVKTGIEDKIINLSINKIREIKSKIIIAFGMDKITPIKGILKSEIPDILITDEPTAIEIIK
ncbi:MAG: hypothetical protein H8E13_21730 [Actinobacteria bacterium]|nr:hypothetical protein [Actinomycetota bacterium]